MASVIEAELLVIVSLPASFTSTVGWLANAAPATAPPGGGGEYQSCGRTYGDIEWLLMVPVSPAEVASKA